MTIIPPSVSFWHGPDYDEALSIVESAARTCYRSEDKAGEGTAEKLIRHCISRGHESVLEHVSFGMRIVCDRGVLAELTRHRIGVAFSVESTRYCNYGQHHIQFIEPWWWHNENETDGDCYPWSASPFINVCDKAEGAYKDLLKRGASPQAARAVLPLSLATTISMTANLREWRHIFKLRCDKAAHPDMRRVMCMALEFARDVYPVFFEDIPLPEEK